MAVALDAVDVLAAADMMDVVDADFTAVTDVEAVAMTVVDISAAEKRIEGDDIYEKCQELED